MMDSPTSWRTALSVAIPVFLVAAIGCAIAFALWLQDVSTPQVTILGSGNRLSVMVADGPARLVLATGDDPIEYENGLARFQPLFARRIDLLLVAGEGDTLRVPAAAHDDHPRLTLAVAPLLPSLEAEAIGPISSLAGPRRIRLGPNLVVTIETVLPYGTRQTDAFPSWRITIVHGESRIVVLSDGAAADDFPPGPPASVLVVSGADPATAWELVPAVAVVAHEQAIPGPALREAFAGAPHPPSWGFRVFPGEALRIRFIDGGIEIPSESAQALSPRSKSGP